MCACNTTAAAFGLPLQSFAEAELQAKIASRIKSIVSFASINPQDALKRIRKIGKTALASLCKKAGSVPGSHTHRVPSAVEVKEEFMFQCLMQQSKNVSWQLQHVLQPVTVGPAATAGGFRGSMLVEVCRVISLEPGIEFLRLQGDKYIEVSGLCLVVGISGS